MSGKIRVPAGPMNKDIVQYSQEWHRQGMVHVKSWLDRTCPSQMPTDETVKGVSESVVMYLAALLERFEVAQEVLLGKDALGDRSSMAAKIPYKCFADFTPGGGVCIVLEQLMAHRQSTGATFEALIQSLSHPPGIDAAARHQALLPMAPFILQVGALIRERKIVVPKAVFFAPGVHDEARLAGVVRAKGGTVVQREEESSISVAATSEEDDDADDLAGTCTVAKTINGMALLQWFRTPDSYSEWVPAAEAENVMAEQPTQKAAGPERVTARYIKDLEVYNEWGRAGEYKPGDVRSANAPGADAMGSSAVVGETKSQKYKGVVVSGGKWQAVCYLPGQGRISVGSFGKEEEAARAYDKAALKNLGYARAKINFNKSDYQELIDELKEKDARIGKDPERHMGVGAQAQAMKKHRQSSKNAQAQLQANPQQTPPPGLQAASALSISFKASSDPPPPPVPVNVAAARMYSSKHLATQDPDMMHWIAEPVVLPSYASWYTPGKAHDIERAAFPDMFPTGPDGVASETSAVYVSLRDAIIQLYRDMPSKRLLGTDCLKHVSSDAATVVRIHAFCNHWGLINYEARGAARFQKADYSVRAGGQGGVGGARCGVTGAVLDRVMYECWKDPDVRICPQAYGWGLLPRGFVASDFVRKVAGEGADGEALPAPSMSGWSEEETQELVRAVEHCGDEWDLVARCVGGGRSAQDCLLQFARLPLADSYVEEVCPGGGKGGTAGKHPREVGEVMEVAAALRIRGAGVCGALGAALGVLAGAGGGGGGGADKEEWELDLAVGGEPVPAPAGKSAVGEEEASLVDYVQAKPEDEEMKTEEEEGSAAPMRAPTPIMQYGGSGERGRVLKRKHDGGEWAARAEGGRVFAMGDGGEVKTREGSGGEIPEGGARLSTCFLTDEASCESCWGGGGVAKELVASLREGLSERGACEAATRLIEASAARVSLRLIRYEKSEMAEIAMKAEASRRVLGLPSAT